MSQPSFSCTQEHRSMKEARLHKLPAKYDVYEVGIKPPSKTESGTSQKSNTRDSQNETELNLSVLSDALNSTSDSELNQVHDDVTEQEDEQLQGTGIAFSCETKQSNEDIAIPGELEETNTNTDKKLEKRLSQIESIYVNFIEEVHTTIDNKLSDIIDSHTLVVQKLDQVQSQVKKLDSFNIMDLQKLFEKQTREQFDTMQSLMYKQLSEQRALYENLLTEKDKTIINLRKEVESYKVKSVKTYSEVVSPKYETRSAEIEANSTENIYIGASISDLTSDLDDIGITTEPTVANNNQTNTGLIQDCEVLFLHDSTGKYINPKQMFGKRSVVSKKFSTAKDANTDIDSWDTNNKKNFIIVVQLGINDVREKNNTSEAVTEVSCLLTRLKNKYSNAKIGYSSPVAAKNARSNTRKNVIEFNRNMKQFCHEKSFLYIDHQNMHQVDHLVDTEVHPTYEGTKVLVSNIHHTMLGSNKKMSHNQPKFGNRPTSRQNNQSFKNKMFNKDDKLASMAMLLKALLT